MDAPAVQIHSEQASSGGLLGGHNAQGKGGLIAAPVAAVTKAEPVVPVAAQANPNDRIGTVSIPKLGADWKHYLVEGVTDANLALPGTDNPDAVQNHETAVAHNTGTQNLGEVGTVGLEAHRTQNTLLNLDTLEHGDTISVTDTKTGTVYTYAVIETTRDNPKAAPSNPKREEVGLPYSTPDEVSYASSVMDPTPFDDSSISTPGHPAKNPAQKRLLALTSCGSDPSTTSDWRIYVIAELQSVNRVNVK